MSRPNIFDGGTEFVAFDVETTGLWPMTDRIVELGAIRFDRSGREIARFHSLIRPDKPMSQGAFEVNGISDAMVAHAPDASAILPEFVDFLGDSRNTLLLAHHAAFDAGFVGCELGRRGLPIPSHPIVDTIESVYLGMKDLKSYSLPSLADYFGLDATDTHRALGDCGRVKALWMMFGRSSCDRLKTYYFKDHAAIRVPPPAGWNDVQAAIDRRRTIRFVYLYGRTLNQPRDATPLGFLQKRGNFYLDAICHISGYEKTFRIDRIVDRRILPSASD